MDIKMAPHGISAALGECFSRLQSRREKLTCSVLNRAGMLFVAGFLALPAPSFALDTFKSVTLPTGIALEIPEHWEALSVQERKNVADFANAIADKAGIPEDGGVKTRLIALNSNSTPIGAKFRVSSTTPSPFTAATLTAATPADLEGIKQDMFDDFKKAEKAGSSNVTAITAVDVTDLDGHPTLAVVYRRGSIGDPADIWAVMLLRTPLPDRLVEVTLSWRVSETERWLPAIRRVAASIKFQAASERAFLKSPGKT